MTGTALALHATVLAGLVIGVPACWLALRAPGDRRLAAPVRRWHHPGWWLAAVTALILVNQVLFTVYILRVHHGDVSWLSGSVPAGWFQLADRNPLVLALADGFPAPWLLSVTAMRIPSLLELPFGLLAYLTVLHWLDPRRYHRLATPPVLWSTSVAYTITFDLIEVALPTPYTAQNLVLRGFSAVLCATALSWLGRRPATAEGTGAPRTIGELLAFVVSVAALGSLVMACYDSVLLYSMGRLGGHLPGMAAAGAALLAARFAAGRLRAGSTAGSTTGSTTGATGPGLDTLVTGLAWWLALFLVPALAIRYELGFGSRLAAAGAGLLVTGAAVAGALAEVAGRLPIAGRRAAARAWLVELAVALLAAGVAAAIGLAPAAGHTEVRLLRAAVLGALAAMAVCGWLDRRAASPLAPQNPAPQNPATLGLAAHGSPGAGVTEHR